MDDDARSAADLRDLRGDVRTLEGRVDRVEAKQATVDEWLRLEEKRQENQQRQHQQNVAAHGRLQIGIALVLVAVVANGFAQHLGWLR